MTPARSRGLTLVFLALALPSCARDPAPTAEVAAPKAVDDAATEAPGLDEIAELLSSPRLPSDLR